jgi:hypothetical protein
VLHLKKPLREHSFECMVCAGLPSWPGSWFVHREAAVLS